MAALSILNVFSTCLFFLAALFLYRWLSKRTYKLFPGPTALPIIGSVHHLPFEHQEKTFADWTKTYGEVIYLKLFKTPTIVLNSLESARDLLDKRGAQYSDRPRMVLLAELGGHELSLPSMRYGDRFRKHRRWMHEAVANRASLERYRPIQRREVNVLLQNLLGSPQAFFEHTHKYVVAVLLEVTYGRRLKSMDDELARVAEVWISAVNDGGNPGSMLVDFFPFLKHIPTWMPGAGFKKRALMGRDLMKAWSESGVELTKSSMASGTGSPCVVSSLLEAHEFAPSLDELDDIRAIGVSMYGAGTETTVGTMHTFFLAMTLNPRVFRKAQEEIDRVIGNERLPEFNDRKSLPYLNALLEEVYRWNPGLPLAIPHRVMSDDQYKGYDIPEGCMVLPNIWNMTRDMERYPDPEEFRPERFLEQADDRELPSSFVFGFGRRACPGQALADATLWLAIANVIAAFDIGKPVDGAGREFTPPADFLPGFTSRPKPFSCTVKARSPAITSTFLEQDS